MNNKYKIKIKHPLIRSGIEIETESSEKYLVDVLKKVLEKVREFNTESAPLTKIAIGDYSPSYFICTCNGRVTHAFGCFDDPKNHCSDCNAFIYEVEDHECKKGAVNEIR